MPISLVGTQTSSSTTVTIPAHQAGDLILIWAMHGGATTIPTLPAGYNSVLTKSNSTATALAARLGWKLATSSSDTSGTWTNASEMCCHVYRPSAGSTLSIGASASSSSTTATVNYPALTLNNSDGTSWVAGFGAASNTTQVISTAPSGMTNESTITGASYSAAGYDTEGAVATWSSTNANVTNTGSTVSATVEIVVIPPGNTLPNIYQHIAQAGGNASALGGNGSTPPGGNNFKIPVDYVGAGNCVVLFISYLDASPGAPTSITDNLNGTWPAATISQSNGSGLDAACYVYPDSAAGQMTITVNFSTSTTAFHYSVTQCYGIATSSPVAGSAQASPAGPPNTVALLPTNNNATGGNLILTYCAPSNSAPSTPAPYQIYAAAPFTMLSADTRYENATNIADKFSHCTAVYSQATQATVNPNVVIIGDTDGYNILAIALKLSSGAGTAPTNPNGGAFRVGKIQHFNTFSWPSSGAFQIQLAPNGNFRVLCCCDPSLNALTVTDSEGNTWTQDPNLAGFWWVNKVTAANQALMVTITGGGVHTNLSWRFFDVIVAGNDQPFETATGNAQNVASITSFTATPSPSALTGSGLVLCNVGLGQGPGKGVTSPSGAIWDLLTYTGEVDTPEPFENADLCCHYYNTLPGAETWTFSITSNPPNNVTSGGFLVLRALPLTWAPAKAPGRIGPKQAFPRQAWNFPGAAAAVVNKVQQLLTLLGMGS